MENINLVSLGMIIIFVGFILIFFGALTNANSKDTKVAVGGFIGFIPFGFANDKRMIWVLIALMGIVMLFFFAINFLVKR